MIYQNDNFKTISDYAASSSASFSSALQLKARHLNIGKFTLQSGL